MQELKNLWEYLSLAGIHPEVDDRLKRKIRLTNQLVIVACAMSFVQLFATANMPGCSLICAFSIAFYLGCWQMNKMGYFTLSRISFCLLSCVFILIGGGLVTDSQPIFFQLMLIQAFVVPMVVFDPKESFYQVFGLACFMISFASFEYVSEMIPNIEGAQPETFASPIAIIMNGVLCMFTLFIGHRYLQKLNLKAEKDLISALEVSEKRENELVNANNEIEESIRYAHHIQVGLLPSKEDLAVNFPMHHVVNRNSHDTGNDFYWYGGYNHTYVLAVIECSGHRTTRSLINTICSIMLHNIVEVKGCTEPAEMLELLSLELISTLKEEWEKVREGLDISLISVNSETEKTKFAGSKSGLMLIRDNELIHVEADYSDISQVKRLVNGYCQREIDIRPTDNIYLTTSGIHRYFANEKLSKMEPLESILIHNSEYTPDVQLDVLSLQIDQMLRQVPAEQDLMILALKIDYAHMEQVRKFRIGKRSVDSALLLGRAS